MKIRTIYKKVHHHSPGMMSVTYQPPTRETLRVVEEFKAYCRSLGNTVFADPTAAHRQARAPKSG